MEFLLFTNNFCIGRATDYRHWDHWDTDAALGDSHPSDEADNIIHLISWMHKIPIHTQAKRERKNAH